MEPVSIPHIVPEGWEVFGDPRALVEVTEISAEVSTNRVYRLRLEDGSSYVTKVSSYGSYVHFRQDHERIHAWCQALAATRFEGFLADVVSRGDRAFLHRSGPTWMTLYEDVSGGVGLPKILPEETLAPLARELAAFHEASAAADLLPTWKTMGSDVASLRERLERRSWAEARGIGPASADFVREHCDAYLTNTDQRRFASLPRIPILVDWNIGNFTVSSADPPFHFGHRWDYDWFRIEPRVLDFYFFARVVSARGDRTEFTYDADAFFDPRFQTFLRAYHEVSPLSRTELDFLPEAYRFFLLNYAVADAEHFFRPAYCEQLRRDVIERHLPVLPSLDFSPLHDLLD